MNINKETHSWQAGGPPGSRTQHQRIMRTTTAFAARFQFVVWTVSCHYDPPVQSLHLPFKQTTLDGLGSGSPRRMAEASPNLSGSTDRQSQLARLQPG